MTSSGHCLVNDDQLTQHRREQTHLPALQRAFAGLSERLDNAGFVDSRQTDASSEVLTSTNQYVLKVRRWWRYPGCEVPFTAQMMLVASTSAVSFGRVRVKIHLTDQDWGGESGVLVNLPFYAEKQFQPTVPLMDFESWDRCLIEVMVQLTPATFKREFDLAMAHLERATTP